jgi:hypothetical protein
MSITLRPGARLFSSVCTTELVTVKAPAGVVGLTIGGVPPVTSAADRSGGPVADGHGGGSQMGKRYVDADGTIELLCTKPGEGIPALDGAPLEIKGARALPASD